MDGGSDAGLLSRGVPIVLLRGALPKTAGYSVEAGRRPPDAAQRPCHQGGPPLQVDRHHGNGQATSYGPASTSSGCQSTC